MLVTVSTSSCTQVPGQIMEILLCTCLGVFDWIMGAANREQPIPRVLSVVGMYCYRAVASGATGVAMAVPLFEECTSASDSLTHPSVLWYR